MIGWVYILCCSQQYYSYMYVEALPITKSKDQSKDYVQNKQDRNEQVQD